MTPCITLRGLQETGRTVLIMATPNELDGRMAGWEGGEPEYADFRSWLSAYHLLSRGIAFIQTFFQSHTNPTWISKGLRILYVIMCFIIIHYLVLCCLRENVKFPLTNFKYYCFTSPDNSRLGTVLVCIFLFCSLFPLVFFPWCHQLPSLGSLLNKLIKYKVHQQKHSSCIESPPESSLKVEEEVNTLSTGLKVLFLVQ